MSGVELIELEPMPGRRLPLTGEVTFGREGCDVTISSELASRRHAAIVVAAGGAEVSDLGSINGTFVNDVRIEGARLLKAGDRVRIGDTAWEIAIAEPAPATKVGPRPDVPAPAVGAGSASTVSPGTAPDSAPLSAERRPRGPATRRVPATVVYCAVAVLVAIVIVLYLATR